MLRPCYMDYRECHHEKYLRLVILSIGKQVRCRPDESPHYVVAPLAVLTASTVSSWVVVASHRRYAKQSHGSSFLRLLGVRLTDGRRKIDLCAMFNYRPTRARSMTSYVRAASTAVKDVCYASCIKCPMDGCGSCGGCFARLYHNRHRCGSAIDGYRSSRSNSR